MRIPAFYCPNCRRFKHFWQVTNVDGWDYGNCKHCGTECYETKRMIARLIEKEIDEGRRDKENKK